MCYAIGEHAAIGFDPWAIDRAHPAQFDPPLVDPGDGRWSEEAYDLRDSYRPIREAMIPIAEAQGTDALRLFVQEDGETGILLDYGDVRIQIGYHHRKEAARGLLVRQGPSAFLFAGCGFSLRFFDSAGIPVAIPRAERGRYRGREWERDLSVRREGVDTTGEMKVVEAGVIRVWLQES